MTGKYGKARLLPLHRTVADGRTNYLRQRDRLLPAAGCPALLVSSTSHMLGPAASTRRSADWPPRPGCRRHHRPAGPGCRSSEHFRRDQFRPAPADTDRHVADGLVQRVHGGLLPARDRRHSQRGRQLGRRAHLAGPVSGRAIATLLVRPDSLVAVLAAAEQCVTKHGVDAGQVAELMAALADLRASLQARPGSSRTSNEPKTEPRRAADE